MNAVSVSALPTPSQTLEALVTQEIELQLGTLPGEVAKSVDKAQAIAYVLDFLPPVHGLDEIRCQKPRERLTQMLKELICDAATLSLIRLVCALGFNS